MNRPTHLHELACRLKLAYGPNLAPNAASALDFLWQVYNEGAGDEFNEWRAEAGLERTGGIGVSFLELYRAMHAVPKRQSVHGQPRATKDSRLVLSDAEMMHFVKHKFELLSQINGMAGEFPWETRADENPSLWPDDYDVATPDDWNQFRSFCQQTGPSLRFGHAREWPIFLFQLLQKDIWYKCVRNRSGMPGSSQPPALVACTSTLGMQMQPTMAGPPGTGLYPCGQQGMGMGMGSSVIGGPVSGGMMGGRQMMGGSMMGGGSIPVGGGMPMGAGMPHQHPHGPH